MVDPWANKEDARREYGVDLGNLDEIQYADCVIVAVAHKEFREMTMDALDALYGDNKHKERVLIDVKGVFDKKTLKDRGYRLWRL